MPIAILVLILRWRRSWRWVLFALVLAIFVALPNLMTLGIVIGRGTRHTRATASSTSRRRPSAAERLAGALLAVGLVAFVAYLLVSRGRAH